MNWKFQLGRLAHRIEQRFIRSNSSFVKNNFPYGRDWMLDAKRALKDATLLIDAGANVGSVSIDLNFWFPDADIYAFEPIKETFRILKNNVSAKGKIHPVNMGLGAKDEQVQILLNSENSINSLKITETYDSIIGTEDITISRLDGFLEKLGLDHIDILKIDVEGFEFEVLAGCGALINDAIKCIYLEVGYSREPTKVHFSDVEAFMEKNGFELCGIYETRRNLFDKRRLWYSNNLYIKKSLLAESL
jgi:FkbM family methyltransferase